jgi:hypothetical protein
MKESIVLLKSIKRGYYSDNAEERINSKGGFLMREGAEYTYDIDPNWSNGEGFYYHGTHIILEKDIDWTMFCKKSEYYIIIDELRKKLAE